MLGLGIIAYTPIDATIAFSPTQLFSAQVKTEIFSLFSQVNPDDSVVATSGWKEFYSDEGNFSVFFPDTSVTNLNSKSEDYSINIYYADTKKSSYIVGYVDYSMDLSKLSLSQVYNNFLKEFLGVDVKLLNRQNITLDKYSGLEVEYQNENQEIIAKIRLFLVDKRLYFLDISNSKAGDAKQFFSSFQLENYVKTQESEIAINPFPAKDYRLKKRTDAPSAEERSKQR